MKYKGSITFQEEGYNSFTANDIEGSPVDFHEDDYHVNFDLPEGRFLMRPEMASRYRNWLWTFSPEKDLANYAIDLVALNDSGDIDFRSIKVPEDAIAEPPETVSESAPEDTEAGTGDKAACFSEGTFVLPFDNPVFTCDGVEGQQIGDGNVEILSPSGMISIRRQDEAWTYKYIPNDGFENREAEITAISQDGMFMNIHLGKPVIQEENSAEVINDNHTELEDDSSSQIRHAIIPTGISNPVSMRFGEKEIFGTEEMIPWGDGLFINLSLLPGKFECDYSVGGKVEVPVGINDANGSGIYGILVFDTSGEPLLALSENTPQDVKEVNAEFDLVIPWPSGRLFMESVEICVIGEDGAAKCVDGAIVSLADGSRLSDFAVERFETGILTISFKPECAANIEQAELSFVSGDEKADFWLGILKSGENILACACEKKHELSGTLDLPRAFSYRIGEDNGQMVNGETVFAIENGAFMLASDNAGGRVSWRFEPNSENSFLAPVAVAAIEDGKITGFAVTSVGRKAQKREMPEKAGMAQKESAIDLLFDTAGEDCVLEIDGWSIRLGADGQSEMNSESREDGSPKLIDTILPMFTRYGIWRVSCSFRQVFQSAAPFTISNGKSMTSGDIVYVEDRYRAINIRQSGESKKLRGVLRMPENCDISINGKTGTPCANGAFRFMFNEGVFTVEPRNDKGYHPYVFEPAGRDNFDIKLKVDATDGSSKIQCAVIHLCHNMAPRILNDPGRANRISGRTGMGAFRVEINDWAHIQIGDTLIDIDEKGDILYGGELESVYGNLLVNNCALKHVEGNQWFMSYDYAILSGETVDVAIPVSFSTTDKTWQTMMGIKLDISDEVEDD